MVTKNVGTVKGVLSGDSLLLIGSQSASEGSAPEMLLGLNFVEAPRVSSHPSKQDEVCK